MTFPTFTPPVNPSPGASLKPEIKTQSIDFGDGYTQESPDGINNVREVITLTWETLTLTQMQTIRSFLVGQKGTAPFYFNPIAYGVPMKWTCKDWSVASPAGYYSITATFRQSFLVDA